MNQKRRIVALLLALCMAVCLFASCAKEQAPTVSPSASLAPTESAQIQESLPKEDRAGNAIVLPEKVETIVSMAPSTTQILVDLGLADKIIAVDTNSPLYTDALSADVKQFDMMNPDLEALIALKPDIIFTSNLSAAGGEDPFQKAIDANICVANIPTSSTVADVEKDILFTAQCVGKSSEGQAIVDEMESKMDAIKKIAATIPEEEKKTVLFEIACAPDIYSFGSGVYLDELITMLGAKNVLSDQQGWVALSEEAAVSANPDVILTNVNYIENPVEEILARASFANVTAVKEKAVFQIDNGASSLPNHHIVTALEEMAKAVYPNYYGA